MSEVIERALTCTVEPDVDIAALEARLEKFKNLKLPREKDVLPIEMGAYRKVKKQQNEVEATIKRVETVKALTSKYLTLSFEPMTWRNADGFPLLVPFSVKNPQTVIAGSTRGGKHVSLRHVADTYYWSDNDSADLRWFKASYQDLKTKLIGPRGGENYLRYQFDAFIPPEVRKQIGAAQKLGLDCFIIAEPLSHEIKRVQRVDPDPLAVGIDATGKMWLLGDFDVTTIEEMMVFTDVESE